MKDKISRFLKFFYPWFSSFFSYQVYAYLSVGTINTLLNIALFAFFYFLLGPENLIIVGQEIASYTVSLLFAFLCTVPTGYWLSKHFAFNSKSTSRKEDATKFIKYFLVVSQGMFSDYLLLKLLIGAFSIYPTAAKVISTILVLFVNFLLQKFYTFRELRSVRSKII